MATINAMAAQKITTTLIPWVTNMMRSLDGPNFLAENGHSLMRCARGRLWMRRTENKCRLCHYRGHSGVRMNRVWAAAATAALGLTVVPAAAQTNSAVETVVVTGAKLPEPVGNAAFSVVNLNQTALSQFDQLDTSLEQVPGLSLFRRSTSLNSNPTTDGVSLRSIAPSGAGRALVLLDGVPLNDPFGNWVIWSALPHEGIGSAEIERGAGSGPYGAGALTGTILLSERNFTDGISEADASAGNLGTYRAGASGGMAIGKVDLFGSADGERSNGWIPVLPSQRGAADTHTWLDDGAATLRAQTQFDDVIATARIGYYDQALGAGLEGAESKARGETASLTLAEPAASGSIGWRAQ